MPSDVDSASRELCARILRNQASRRVSENGPAALPPYIPDGPPRLSIAFPTRDEGAGCSRGGRCVGAVTLPKDRRLLVTARHSGKTASSRPMPAPYDTGHAVRSGCPSNRVADLAASRRAAPTAIAKGLPQCRIDDLQPWRLKPSSHGNGGVQQPLFGLLRRGAGRHEHAGRYGQCRKNPRRMHQCPLWLIHMSSGHRRTGAIRAASLRSAAGCPQSGRDPRRDGGGGRKAHPRPVPRWSPPLRPEAS